MEILEIQMKHFGRFINQKMSFHSGVNVIYGENETGKSTMHSFIRGMLYGIERQRGRAKKNDEYSLRKPWEGGGCFDGSMSFTCAGKTYHLERSFDKREKKARLFCETDGYEWDIGDGGMEILPEGMSESVFCNTVCISQLSGKTDEGLAIAVKNFMVNAQSGECSDIDVGAAMERLQNERRELEKRKKQQMAEQVERSQEIRVRMDYAAGELQELKKEEKQCEDKLRRLGGGGTRQEEKESAGFWKAGRIAMAVLAVAALAIALVVQRWEIKAACCMVILLSCVGVWGFQKAEGRERKKKEQRATRHGNREKGQKAALKLEWLQAARREKERLLLELEEQYQEMQDFAEAGSAVEESLSAVYLAIDTLEEVSSEIYEEYAKKLNERVSEILSRITGGRYTSIFLDECLQVKVYTPQRLLEIEQVSRGTMEQIYFALRMAAAELLSPREPMPILLDDAFAMYDNTRLEHTLRWLCSSGHQVLLFTCQKREQEILQQIYEE